MLLIHSTVGTLASRSQTEIFCLGLCCPLVENKTSAAQGLMKFLVSLASSVVVRHWKAVKKKKKNCRFHQLLENESLLPRPKIWRYRPWLGVGTQAEWHGETTLCAAVKTSRLWSPVVMRSLWFVFQCLNGWEERWLLSFRSLLEEPSTSKLQEISFWIHALPFALTVRLPPQMRVSQFLLVFLIWF